MIRLLPITFLCLFLFACSTIGEGYMQQDELLSKIKQGQAPVIIDVRSTYEFNNGHVPGAINIPFWNTWGNDKLDQLDKTESLVVYCEHGPRAGIARFSISLNGFKNISYLSGHMTGWKKAGLPIENIK